MTKRLGAAAVIVNDAGEVLLVKHTYGRLNWELPGGNSEDNESGVETVLREVREETGLRVAIDRLTGIYYERDGDIHHFVFACRRLDASASPQPDHHEISNAAYWPLDALPRPMSDFTFRRIQDALAENTQVSLESLPPRQWLD